VTVRPRTPLGCYALQDPDFHVESPEGTSVLVDLSSVSFVYPFGLVFLDWYIRDLFSRGARSVEVRVPSEDVGNYLVRMRLVSAFEDDERARFDVPWETVRERDRRDVLVELERFRVLNDDEVEELASRLVRVITEMPGPGVGFEPLFLTVCEAISNVEVHSGEEGGTVAVQRYRDSVCLAFADAGVGIPARLGSQFPGESPGSVIAHAVEPGVSSRVGGGGMGLAELADLVTDEGERLTIHSDSGQIAVTPEGIQRVEGCCPIRGTLLEVQLRVRSG